MDRLDLMSCAKITYPLISHIDSFCGGHFPHHWANEAELSSAHSLPYKKKVISKLPEDAAGLPLALSIPLPEVAESTSDMSCRTLTTNSPKDAAGLPLSIPLPEVAESTSDMGFRT